MRALITGINGFVGGHLAEHLLASGEWELWGLARSPALTLPKLQGSVQVVCADLRNKEQMAAAIAETCPEVIFHLAGQPFVPESFRDPIGTFEANLLGTLNIFLALIDQRISPRILIVGTYEEYGLVRPEDQPIDEQTPLRPTNPYGVSKAAQSLLSVQYHLSHYLDIVRVRPFNHIGPRQNERFVTPAWSRQIARIERGLQPALMMVGNLSVERDFTDVRDIARAYEMVVRQGNSGEVYNVGSGHPIALRVMLEKLLCMSTTEIKVQTDPKLIRPIDVPLVVCNPSHLHKHTGWEPQFTIDQTLNDILNDWRGRVASEVKGNL